VIASVLYLLVRQVLQLAVLALRSDRKKDIEIVVLRRELVNGALDVTNAEPAIPCGRSRGES
jgi:hypothetical protein